MIATCTYQHTLTQLPQFNQSKSPSIPLSLAPNPTDKRTQNNEHQDVRQKLRTKLRTNQIQSLKSLIRYNLCIQHLILSKTTLPQPPTSMSMSPLCQQPVIKFKRLLKILSKISIDQEMIHQLVLALRYRLRDKLCLILFNFVMVGCRGRGKGVGMSGGILGQFLEELVMGVKGVCWDGGDLEYVAMGIQLIYKIIGLLSQEQISKINLSHFQQLIMSLGQLRGVHPHIEQKMISIMSRLPHSHLDYKILEFRPASSSTKINLIKFAKQRFPVQTHYHKKQLLSLYSWIMQSKPQSEGQIQQKLNGHLKYLCSAQICRIAAFSKKAKNSYKLTQAKVKPFHKIQAYDDRVKCDIQA